MSSDYEWGIVYTRKYNLHHIKLCFFCIMFMFIDSNFALIFYRGCFSVDDEITHVYVTQFFLSVKKN